MKYQLVHADYIQHGTVRLFGRDEHGYKRMVHVNGFEPYFYAPDNANLPQSQYVTRVQGGYENVFGKKMSKIFVTHPKAVSAIRDDFKGHHEADIVFPRRFIIDKEIFSGFECGRSNEIWHTDIRPAEMEMLPLTCFLDIEVGTPDGRFPDPELAEWPVVCVCCWDSRTRIYITFIIEPKKQGFEWLADDHIIYYCASEYHLLQAISKYLRKIWPDIVSGWNIDFDINTLINRSKKSKVNFFFDGINKFDLYQAYVKTVPSPRGRKLKDVVVFEEFSTEEELVSSEYHFEFWTNPDLHDKLIEYNRDDVRYCVLIDEKYNITGNRWIRKSSAGLEDMEGTIYDSISIGTVALRILGTVIPSKRVPQKSDTIAKGAIVFDPKVGIHDDLILLDFGRFYPSLIISYNLSPEYAHLSHEERMKMPPGALPRLCMYFSDLRDKYEVILEEQLQKYGPDSQEYKIAKMHKTNAKFLLNAVYGYGLFRRSRLYAKTMMEYMLEKGRVFLSYIKEKAEDRGYAVILGDTDSILIQCKKFEREIAANYIQEELKKRCESEGIDASKIVVKFERYARRGIILRKKDVDGKGKREGAKKRYILRVTLEETTECDYNYYKGIELVRGDTSILTKTIQKDLIDSIFDDKIEEEITKLREIVAGIKADKYDWNKIAINMNFKKELHEYKTNTEYKRGVEYANKHLAMGIQKGDRIKMIFVSRIPGKKHSDVICYTEKSKVPKNISIDTQKTIDRTVTRKIEQYLDAAGYSLNDLYMKTNMAKLYT